MTGTLPSKILLFDGVCYLCNGSVRFVYRFDSDKNFHFGHLQSAAGRALLKRHGLATDELSTFVLIDAGRVYTKSDAWLRVMNTLGWPWRAAGIFWIVPRRVRDAIYDWIGRNRYRWFGRSEHCLVPDPDEATRFLDSSQPPPDDSK